MKLPFVVIFFAAAIFLVLSFTQADSAVAYLKKFDFNDTNPLSHWGTMILNGQVDYRVLKEGGNGYLEGFSREACSAIYYRIGFKLKDYPILTWKWRVSKFPDKTGAVTEKEKDDYAARLYVIFPFLNFSSSRFIEYVWDASLPAGTVLDSPEGDNIKLIVLRSGPSAPVEDWQGEMRNVYEDYVTVFGEAPSRNAGAVAIMCDADSTKTECRAFFDDILIVNELGETRRIGE